MSRFLGLSEADIAFACNHAPVLERSARSFARRFYDFLLEHPATARAIGAGLERGGTLDAMIARQAAQLGEFLRAPSDRRYPARMAQLGELYFRQGIEPVWIMGAYLRSLDHLVGVVRGAAAIDAGARAGLEAAVTKLLFRDMGLVTEGYWQAAHGVISAAHAEAATRQSQASGLLANMPQIIWSVDVADAKPAYLNPAARSFCGAQAEMPVPGLAWLHAKERADVERAWAKALQGEVAQAEARMDRPGDAPRWFRWYFYPRCTAQGLARCIDGVMEDITERRELEARLERLSTTDALTGLPNRTLFRDRLAQAIGAARRDPQRGSAVMVMDLDHFKEINDVLGHAAGDRVLIEVARRITGALRGSDTLTRLGGDEFALLLADSPDPQHTAQRAAQKILEALARPFLVDGHEFFIGASIGIAVFPAQGDEIDILLARADTAMHACKRRDARLLFYDETLDPKAPQRLQLSTEIQRSLARGELVLHYQPIASLHDGRVTDVEALIRWNHPVRGMMAPQEFLPLAERSGLIKPITDWVIETSLRQVRAWEQLGLELRVAVNVSGRVFRDRAFFGRVEQLLAATGVAGDRLELEVTENVLMSEIDEVAGTLAALNRIGIRAAIDDFGTGYSSLAYLKRLPIDRLKIDKSLVCDLSHGAADGPIVRAIIDLAHNLGREVVAEGVENTVVRGLLAGLGCDAIQGFHLSRPLPAAEIEPWMHSGAAAACM